MLWKCCTQYVIKFGKLRGGHSIGKGQFSFQSQRKAVPENAQTTAQLHSFHTLAKYCSKFSKLKIIQARLQQFCEHLWPSRCSSWIRKHWKTRDQIANICWIIKKQDSSRKTSTSASLTMPKPLTVWITTNCGKFLKRWEYQTTLPHSWETYMQVKQQQLELDMEQ